MQDYGSFGNVKVGHWTYFNYMSTSERVRRTGVYRFRSLDIPYLPIFEVQEAEEKWWALDEEIFMNSLFSTVLHEVFKIEEAAYAPLAIEISMEDLFDNMHPMWPFKGGK